MGYVNSKTEPSKRDFWETPDYLVHYCEQKFGCNFDLACNSYNSKFFWGFQAEKHDALKEDWFDLSLSIGEEVIGFCNPPYSNIAPWLEKAIAERAKGFASVFVIPTPNGDKWQDLALEANRIEFITGRVQFIDPITGKKSSGNTRGTMICEFETGRRFIKTVRRDYMIEMYNDFIKEEGSK